LPLPGHIGVLFVILDDLPIRRRRVRRARPLRPPLDRSCDDGIERLEDSPLHGGSEIADAGGDG
jgi:hypothetical protein